MRHDVSISGRAAGGSTESVCVHGGRFSGLETLEPRVLLSAGSVAAYGPTAAATAAVVRPLAVGEPLVIDAQTVTVDAALAAQIVAALQSGRDVTVRATDGPIVVASPIVATQAPADTTLAFETFDRVAFNARVVVGGSVEVTTGVFVQAAGTTVNAAGDVSVLAEQSFDDVTQSGRTLVVAGTIIAGGDIELSALGDIDLPGVMRSDRNAPVSPDSDPFDAKVAAVRVNSFTRIDLDGSVTATSGSIYLSTFTLDVGPTARVRSTRGHVAYSGEDLATAAGSVIEAQRGDIAVIGQISESTLRGILRATGDARADVDLSLALNATLVVADTARIITEGGAVRLGAGTLRVAGVVNTNGGGIEFVAESSFVEITGRVETGRLATADSQQRGGDIQIAVIGGSMLINGRLATRGGNLVFNVRKGLVPSTGVSGITLGPDAVLDTRFAGGVGGDIIFDIGQSELIIQPGAVLLTGGGDIRVQANASYQFLTIDPGGIDPDNPGNPAPFFPTLIRIDGVLNTVSPTFGAGRIDIPTQGVQLQLGTLARTRFAAITGGSAVAIDAAPVLSAGQPPREGGITLGGRILADRFDLNASFIRIAGATTITSPGRVTLAAPVLGVKSNTSRNRNARAASKSSPALTLNAADGAVITGSVTGLRSLTVNSRGTVELGRVADLPQTTGVDASTTTPIRIATTQALTLNVPTLIAPEHALTLITRKSRVRFGTAMNLLAAGGLNVNAPSARLKAVNIVSAAGINLRLSQLRVSPGGGVFANGLINLRVNRITGRPFPAATFTGRVTTQTTNPADARKVQPAALPAAIDPDNLLPPVV